MKEKAMMNKHMTFEEAATLAQNANVKKLWLTHFSPSMHDPEAFLPVAREIYRNTELGYNLKKAVFVYE